MTLAAGVAAGVGLSCMRRMEPASETLASGASQAQSVVRVFRKLVGRDPSASEIAALKDLEYPKLIKSVLESKQFDEEGFFHLHRERLLLHREGTENWVKNSYRDYCAMKLEVAESASIDRSGPGGYFDLLRYTDRWVPVGSVQLEKCFFGSSIDDIVKATDLYGIGQGDEDDDGQTPTEPPPEPTTPREIAARECVRNMAFDFSENWETGPQEAKAFVAKLKALPASLRKKSLVETPIGEDLFLKKIRRNLLPREFQWPETATQPAAMDISIVKKDGRPQFLQEFGKVGNGLCQFTPVDPLEYVRPQPNWNDFGGDEDDEEEDVNDGPDIALPFDPGPAIGLPENPLLVPDGEAVPGEADGAGGEGAGLNLAGEPPEGKLYLKINMPKEAMGVHASPYWLSRHTSKAKNRNLHRARLMYFSYFCADINPDAANFSGDPINDLPEFIKPYFAEDDTHTKGSQNCYNCHAKVQPMANFFGLSSWGTPYDPAMGGGDDGAWFDENGWPNYFANSKAFDRPGGIYDGERFFDAGPNRGMEGLANAMSKYPEARRCIVEGTWAAMVGRDYPLFDNEREAALKAFGNNGTPRLGKLVAHLATENQRGVAFFTKGENEMAKIQPTVVVACPETLTEAIETKALSTLGQACSNCHAGEFINDDNKFSVDHYFEQENDEDTPKVRGELWHKLHCKVKQKRMPPANSGINLDQTTRDAVWCYLEKKRDELASAGTIPAEYKGKLCPGAPAPESVSGGVHNMPSMPSGGGN
jgi:hypothetical protein